jgi:tripeptide aminopeptidase
MSKTKLPSKSSLKNAPKLSIDKNDTGGYEPDLSAALERVMKLMAIRGKSGEETEVVAFIKNELVRAGANASDITTDNAHKNTPIDGKTGNLIFKLDGTVKAPRRMLMGHMDTVPVCVGAKPIIDGDTVKSADPKTGLGADNRSGVTVALTAAIEILKRRLPHPPLTFFFPIQEEIGLFGARFADLKQLGNPKLGFNWDGSAAERLIVGATGAYRIEINVRGILSHAGVAPENGVSAIAITSLAIADLTRNGWHGLIVKGKSRGTSNFGIVQGGDATNVVTEHVFVKAEARSHDPKFRKKILDEITKSFERAVKEVKNAKGKRGSVEITPRMDYESFKLDDNEPCVVAAEDVMTSIGLKPSRVVSNGGLDANWLSSRGLPTVSMGCGQMNIHSTEERLDIAGFNAACRVALRLATDCD